ncbi:MAG: DNA polymerase IV [Acidimicrobiales bacterium]|jgi:DNA polymerase-4|nr:DNA polymerase IV [Acidimicrobiales bacterium]
MSSARPPDGTLGFVHVDMDAFFASVELRRHPELQGQPVVVGGTGDRGVVAAASYEARLYGIHSAMPSTRARRACPHAVFLPGDHAHYAEVSTEVMAILRDTTPLVEPLSLDEAFLDVRGALHGEDRAAELAAEIRARVLRDLRLTCSVGVATNKFIAKLATERAKPSPSARGPVFGSGVFVVPAGEELAFLHPIPVRELWGVGPATGRKLSGMGIETVGDLATQPLSRIEAGVGRAAGAHLHALANGRDERPVEVDQELKSIGHEETFARDLVVIEDIRPHLVRMADAVAARLRKGSVLGRTVTIKVRFADFTTITRSITLSEPIDGARVIATEAETMLARLDPTPGVRLFGVSLSQLVDGSIRQLSLDEVAGPAWTDADAVIDDIRDRFGSSAIGPAALARPGEGLRRFEVGQQQWGPDERP